MRTHIFLLLSLLVCLSVTTSNSKHLVILYDSSRDIYVMLTDTQAFFNWGIGSDPDAGYWNLIAENPTGTWTSDTRFTDQTGYFEHTQGDHWDEVQNSGNVNHFIRVQPGQVVSNSQSTGSTGEGETLEVEILDSSENGHLVILYDKSRDIYVMLTDSHAFFNWGIGSDPNGGYWNLIAENPTGTWTSDTRFTDQTGYFEQAQGDNWIENQYSGNVNHFVRVQPGEIVSPEEGGTLEGGELEGEMLGSSWGDHLVILYDGSRDIYVMLTDTQAFFNWGIGSDPNGGYWNLIAENPTGTWTSDTRFTDQTGYFEQAQGDNWIENQYSGNVNHFIRVQPGQVVSNSQSTGSTGEGETLEAEILDSSEDGHLVILYDKSRDIYVMLTDSHAFFNWGIGSDPNGGYWNLIAENPTGTWTSDTRFTDQTGYFEHTQGDNWAEVQNSGNVNHFVRVQPGEIVSPEEGGTLEGGELEGETLGSSWGDHLVILYDGSRDISVMLTDTQAFFNWGISSDPDAGYWSLIPENPTGTWTSDTRFTVQTGYFEHTQGDNWAEVQNSGNVNHFVRVN